MQEQKKAKVLPPLSEKIGARRVSPKALLLAAGFASRMGSCKALLDLGGRSPLERAVRSLRSGGVEEIVVVSGHYRDAVEAEARRLNCSTTFNERYEKGMFSSVQCGLKALGDAEAFLLLPVDVPLVSPATIGALLRAHEEGAPLAYPTFSGRRGHPPLVGRSFFGAIAEDDGSRGGLRTLLAEKETEARDVAVADEAILLDMDSPEDYDRLRERALRRGIPSEAECEALWDLAGTPPGVRRHGEAVAAVADRFAVALEGTLVLDREKLRSAALVHDLARGSENHAEEGARILIRWGFDAIAPLVASHMAGPDDDGLDEASLLFAADKIVEGTTVVSLAIRRERMARRFADRPSSLRGAMERLNRAESLLRAIERAAGQPLLHILGDLT